MNGALLLLKHGANIEAQDEHVNFKQNIKMKMTCFFDLA
jgi:hypothetical protein